MLNVVKLPKDSNNLQVLLLNIQRIMQQIAFNFKILEFLMARLILPNHDRRINNVTNKRNTQKR